MPDKVLSVRQPWAHLVIAGIKTVENRSWVTPYRGRLFIHASAAKPEGDWFEYFDEFELGPDLKFFDSGIQLPPLKSLVRGAIVGSVDLMDCLADDDERLDDIEWAEAIGFCWLLANAVALDKPFPCPGKLRLWDLPAGFKE